MSRRTHLDAPFELKALEEDGTFTGYGSVFDVIDSYNERVAPGAFKRTLASWKRKGRMPALLWQHNADQPIGVYTRMREDNTGLIVEGQLALRTARGAEAYELLKMDAVSGLSIGFTTIRSEYDDKKGIRTLTEIDLWETSIVTFPANEEARIDAVKSVRDWERLLMRDAGLSRSEALCVINDGVKALLAKRDAGDGLHELREIIDRTRAVLTS